MSAVLDPPELSLEVCHHDGTLKNFFNRLMPTHGRGAFINTFYVSCANKDGKECDECKHFKANNVRDVSLTPPPRKVKLKAKVKRG